MALAQLAQVGLRALDVAGAGVGGNAEQAIGHFRQRRHDDDRTARVAAFLLRVGLPLRTDDGDQTLDGGLIGHRRAAEFHYDHDLALRARSYQPPRTNQFKPGTLRVQVQNVSDWQVQIPEF